MWTSQVYGHHDKMARKKHTEHHRTRSLKSLYKWLFCICSVRVFVDKGKRFYQCGKCLVISEGIGYICLNLFETIILWQLFRIYRLKYIRELCTLPLVVIFDQRLTGFQTI